MNGNPRNVTASVSIDIADVTPYYNCDHDDGTYSVGIAQRLDLDSVYVNGTLDELAKFVLDLATVVRELNARELADAS